jgi:hypothetical protein
MSAEFELAEEAAAVAPEDAMPEEQQFQTRTIVPACQTVELVVAGRARDLGSSW